MSWWTDLFTPYLSVGQLPPGQEYYVSQEFKRRGIKVKYTKGIGGRWFARVEKTRWNEAKQIIRQYISGMEPY